MKDKIIIIEEENSTCRLLIQFLSEQGFNILNFSDSSQALTASVHSHDPALIIFDVTMPSLTSLNLCSEIRKFCDKPVLFLSQYIEDQFRIDALNRGGDEHITKPISFELLLAQINAHIRRYKRAFPVNQRHLILYTDLEIDLFAHTVISYGMEVALSTKEYELLVILAKNPNRVFHTQTLYDLIWSDNNQGDVRTVMVHIYNLRQKVEITPSNPRYIHTVRGAGYKFIG